MAAIYIHIPFCVRKCEYCDFVSYAGAGGHMPRYAAALLNEIKTRAGELDGRRIDSVYIGGGTPPLIGAAALRDALDCIRDNYDLAQDAEITCELNPGAANSAALFALAKAGVNRLSMGVQAAQDGLLKALGRIHDFDAAMRTYNAAREAGFDNINLDFMYGIPDQRPDDWRNTLEAAIALEPEHLSLYSLILEEDTPLERRVNAGEVTLPDEDVVMEMLELADALTKAAGYNKYEVSNFAQPGRECRHNLLYWHNGEYLGVGCAAHSRLGMRRIYNDTALTGYMERVEACGSGECDALELSEDDDAFDTLMLGTRLTDGISTAEFTARHGAARYAALRHKLNDLIRRGLLKDDPNRIALTPKGLLLQNQVLVELME